MRPASFSEWVFTRPGAARYTSAKKRKESTLLGLSIESFLFLLELAGTSAFAVSGAVLGIHKGLDIFGILFCAVTTALGGGAIRDILLSNLPPAMFRDYTYFITAVITGVLVFFLAKLHRGDFEQRAKHAEGVINVFDAFGLGVFTVVGIDTGVSLGYGGNAFFVIFLGMTTGCGGGILRDILVREVPLILSRRIYAVASLAGGTAYYLIYVQAGLSRSLSAVIGIAGIFLLRIFASYFRWNLPRAD